MLLQTEDGRKEKGEGRREKGGVRLTEVRIFCEPGNKDISHQDQIISFMRKPRR